MCSTEFLRCASRLLLCLLSVDVLSAFNMDVDHPVFRRGPPNSSFGFSIAQHFQNGKPILLVGAPRADSGQPNTVQAGAVFACAMAEDFSTNGRNRKRTPAAALGGCTQLMIEYPAGEEFQRPPERLNSKSLHSEGKNHQLLGFVIRSSGRREEAESRAMACAPLLRWSPNAFTDGVCYLLNSELNHTGVLSPCETLPRTDRHNDYGACEQGFSGFIDDHVILTGLPGARKWTGGVFGRYQFDSGGFPDTVDRWTMEVGKDQRGVINILTSHDYLGYSVRYGRFGFWYEQADVDGVANFTVVSGATRYNQTGAVVFLPFWRHVQAEGQRQLGLSEDSFLLAGRQLGSGFGSVVEVLDLDADGFDDLLVGAPFEFQPNSDGTALAGGAVYVFYSTGVRRQKGASAQVFRAPLILRGAGVHSQFGAALTRLGNVDNDPEGLQDFAVGAPQSDSGQGSVFIYFGAKWPDFSTDPAQEINANVLNGQRSLGQNLSAFGGALAGGVDMDGDGYVELGVGAHGSDTVALFRARPIIDVRLAHFFPQKHIKIDADSTCSPTAHSCFTVVTTLRILPRNDSSRLLSRHFPGREQPFLCQLQVIPHAKGVLPRAVFVSSGTNSMEWRCGRETIVGAEERQEHSLYVPKGNPDWTNPLRFNLTVSVPRRDALEVLPLPVVNRDQRSHYFEIAFDKKCGEDNECHAELALEATLLDITRREDGIYIAKVTERDSLVVRFLVENRLERAYLAKLFVEYNNDELDEPRLMQRDYQGVLDIERKGEGLVVVGLGNPVEAGRKLSFDLAFKLVRGSSERVSASLNFRALLNSSSVEKDPTNNEWSAEVQLIKEADLQLEGASRPAIVRFSKGNRLVVDEVDIGPQVVHVYTITNRGPFYARNVSLTVSWPLQLSPAGPPTSSTRQLAPGGWALYALEDPLVRHNGQFRRCASPTRAQKTINPMGVYNDETLKLDYQLAKRQRPKRATGRTDRTETEAEAAPATSIFDSGRILRKEVEESSGAKVRIADINCKDGSALCVPLHCHFDYIGRNDSVLIEIRARLWNFTFSADYRAIDYVAISSEGFIEVDPSQGILEDVTNNFARVTTHAYPDRPQQEGQVRVWMLLLAVLIGLALLGLLVLCCSRLGFFKRKRPESLLHQAHYQHNREYDG
ncbi:hypothetical protein GPALN_011023 [Globodera pallida]|nr:hypothetical protein GPALN_011023 [Globodera pallida]